MGNSLKNNSIENIIISKQKNSPIIINGIIDLYYDCFIELDRKNNFKVKSFNDISNFILQFTYNGDTLHRLNKLMKIHKKFNNLNKSFKILSNNKIYKYDELCTCFIILLRKEINQRLSRQFIEQDKAALNSLLYRIEDIYPEK